MAVENYIIKGETEGGGTKYDKKINNILYFVPRSSSKKKNYLCTRIRAEWKTWGVQVSNIPNNWGIYTEYHAVAILRGQPRQIFK